MTSIDLERARLSRRNFLRGAAIVAGGTAALGGGVASAQSKLPQKAAKYQDTPKGAARCDNCTQWQGPSACKIVSGEISPSGWCALYVKNPKA